MDNKTFWKTIKPYFKEKCINHDNITLAENEETVSNKEISETLNNFFSEAVTNLNLPQYDDPTVNAEDIEDPVSRAVNIYIYIYIYIWIGDCRISQFIHYI